MQTSNIRLSENDSKESRDFEKLVMWVSALSIAVMAGFLASLKQVNPAIQFRFSILSVVACVAGGALAVLFFRIVLHGNKRHRALLVVIAAIVSVLGYFMFGIKNASRENRLDVTIGTAIALAALSFVGWLLWCVVRFLDRDDRQNRDPILPP
jgi:FtsH-binding integral membrane protein